MKKGIAVLLAATLAVAPVTLVGCGGASSGSGGLTAEQSEQARQSYVGDWKIVYAEMSGLTLYGPLYEAGDNGAATNFTLNADGTGTVVLETGKADATWEVTDENHAKITITGQGTQTVRYDADYDALFMDATEDDPNVMAYTKDGKTDVKLGLDIDAAVPLASVDDAVGDWQLYGMDSEGSLIYGEGDALTAVIDNVDAFALSVKADGSATMGGNSGYTVTEADGGVFLNKDDLHAPLKSLDGLLLVDTADDEGEEYYLIYAK